MRRTVSTIIICLLSLPAVAQYRVSGLVIDADDSAFVSKATIYLDEGKENVTTDNHGRFAFTSVSNGAHRLSTLHEDFRGKFVEFTINGEDVNITIVLNGAEILQEVVVEEQRNDFGFTQMKSVENLGIYEGKKSEVILPDQLVANLSTNNARQIYSRVAGLNIWENEGAGLQLSIGGRGLDPNRTSNFNVRQNGYDISADALGYPESYYTPPVEAVGRIQIVRGAASLQYGTQFGGMINFVMKKPIADKKLELTARQTIGSFGFYNSFTSASGTLKKLSYYTFFQYKQGDGWRANSHFNNHTFFANVNYAISDKTTVGVDVTRMSYLAQQPGGLTDEMFKADPRQTNRERNWFDVDWNLHALHFNHKFNSNNEVNVRLFGLSAHRYSIGFRPNRVATIDDNSARDLIKGTFDNWGMEARYLKRMKLMGRPSVLLVGTRYYHGFNHSAQGDGSTGKDADFNFVQPEQFITYDYRYPNQNVAVFAESIFNVHEKLSITPGVRFEYIDTRSDGFYGSITRDLAGNIIDQSKTFETRNNTRHFLLGGVGVSYKPTPKINVYSNLSQNYRSITFTDMRISNPSSTVDPNMKDEKGYSFDAGARSENATVFSYDVSFFYLNYNNRIGEIQYYDENNRVLRRRGNIGQAVILGLESYGEADVLGILNPGSEASGVIFGNVALIRSTYNRSEIPGVQGNEVEFVPRLNLKSGIRMGYKGIKMSFQYTHLSDQFSDATNAVSGGVSAVVGIIPSYSVFDLSLSYELGRFKIESNINNLTNQMYYTRRATGYPGPGILPSDGRSFFVTFQVKI